MLHIESESARYNVKKRMWMRQIKNGFVKALIFIACIVMTFSVVGGLGGEIISLAARLVDIPDGLGFLEGVSAIIRQVPIYYFFLGVLVFFAVLIRLFLFMKRHYLEPGHCVLSLALLSGVFYLDRVTIKIVPDAVNLVIDILFLSAFSASFVWLAYYSAFKKRVKDMLDACTTKNLEQIFKCLSQDMSSNTRLPNGLTPVIVCIQHGFLEAIPPLCEKGAQLNVSCNGRTPFLEAVRQRDCDAIRLLVSHGGDPDVGNKTGLRPLMLAAQLGYADCVGALLEGGASVNGTDRHLWTALHEAAFAGQTDSIRLLLSRGADPLAGTNGQHGKDHLSVSKGTVPLHLAARGGHAEAVRILLEHTPVDIRSRDGKTPLLWACECGNRETAALLIASGADIETALPSGPTPLLTAMHRGDLDIIRLLLESGADPDGANKGIGVPVIKAIEPVGPEDKRDSVAIIELLLKFGANINSPCVETGDTALHQAVCARDKPLVTWLLEHGARYGTLNCGKTEVDVAQSIGRPDIAEMLLQYGRKKETPDETMR